MWAPLCKGHSSPAAPAAAGPVPGALGSAVPPQEISLPQTGTRPVDYRGHNARPPTHTGTVLTVEEKKTKKRRGGDHIYHI